MNIAVIEKSGEFYVSSREVATRFKKQHKDVLRAIKNIMKNLSNDFSQRNFAPQKELANTREEIFYLLTRDGFTMLAMGFTGVEAMTWKVQFLEAFKMLEDKVKNKIPELLSLLEEYRKALVTSQSMQAQAAPRQIESAQKNTLMVPHYEMNMFGEMMVVDYQRKILDKIDKIDALEATQKHMQKVLDGINKKMAKVSNDLNSEHRSRSNKAVRTLRPLEPK